MKTFTIEWLKKAKEDYEAAKTLLDSNFMHHSIICFHLQQAAEKYVKAYLTEKDIEFTKTHDIEQLISRFLLDNDPDFEMLLEPSAILTTYGVLPRYPGGYTDFSDEESKQALNSFLEIKNSN